MSSSPTFSFLSWAWLTKASMPQPLSVFDCVVKAKYRDHDPSAQDQELEFESTYSLTLINVRIN